MVLDDLIAELQALKLAQPDLGQSKVVARCPIADEYCWLHADKIAVTPADPGVPHSAVVVIDGGYGA